MIVARASGVAIEEIDAVKSGQEGELSQRMQSEGISLTYPVLETQDGDLFTETPAICSLLAAMGSAQHLAGTTPVEQALVDQWMQFLRTQTLPLAKTLAGAVYGTVNMTAEEHAFITNLLKENVKTVNNQLKSKQWFCGGD